MGSHGLVRCSGAESLALYNENTATIISGGENEAAAASCSELVSVTAESTPYLGTLG